MIFVTLGTQDKNFDRLLIAIDKEIKKGNIKEKVIVQAGTTDFKSDDMEIFDLISKEEFEKLMSKCDLLITHGGVGSIVTGLKLNKKIIAVPRLKKFNDNTNDHQVQIVENFDKAGYIVGVMDLDKLDEGLERIKKFKPKKFKSNTENMIKLIDKYISEF